MPGRVFLSCGQNDRELQIADKVRRLLEGPPFGLKVFVARSTNNLYSLNEDVLTRLADADYFLFVKFHRRADGFPGSLYSHQELAMALALGHRQLLVFSERDAPNLGIIQFMVQNRPKFSTDEELLKIILSPEDMLAVLAMALFAGQRGAAHGRWALFALPGAWLAGGLFGLTVTAMNGVVLTFVPFLLVGGLLAADAALPLSATTALGGLIGSFYGFLNGVDIGRAPDGALVLLGLVFAIFVVVAIASSFVVSLRQQWLRIAVRIVGSWIVASGLLMLGWTLRRS